MPLAQLTASQIAYDQLDWLQIGVYFVALPLVAFLGALLGLVGRWRRGGLVWSTNVGLLGGVVVCLLIAGGLWTLDSQTLTHLLDEYQQSYRWQMLVAALAATASSALVGAVAWRCLHVPQEARPFSFSLRELLLIQCLTLVSLGCWVSLRQFMLQSVDQENFVVQYWAQRHWYLSADGKEIRLGAQLLTPQVLREATSSARLSELPRMLPKLERVVMTVDGASGADFAGFYRHPNLQMLTLISINPEAGLLEEIGASKLNRLMLMGDTDQLDLSPLKRATSLQSLSLNGPLSRSAIAALDGAPVRELELYECKFSLQKRRVEVWPQALESLYVWGHTNLLSADFDSLSPNAKLENLRISEIPLEASALSAIAALPHLKSLELSLGKLDPPGQAALLKIASPEIRLEVKNLSLAESDLGFLPNVKNLKRLTLECFPAQPDVAEILAKCSDVEVLVLDLDGLPVGEVLKLTAMKNLRRLHYHGRLAGQNLESPFHAQREAQQLPPVELRPLPMLASAVGSPPSPNATSKPYNLAP